MTCIIPYIHEPDLLCWPGHSGILRWPLRLQWLWSCRLLKIYHSNISIRLQNLSPACKLKQLTLGKKYWLPRTANRVLQQNSESFCWIFIYLTHNTSTTCFQMFWHYCKQSIKLIFCFICACDFLWCEKMMC